MAVMKKLKALHLKKHYKKKSVVNDVSLALKQGEIVGLLGPNGAGKTTVFYMLVGLVSPASGEVHLGDENITKLSIDKRARKGIGYLPQESSVFRKMTVEQNILAVLELQKKQSRIGQQKRMRELLEEFHLNHVRKNLGMTLSGGEKRRLEIARLVACEPDFILLDEPFAGVDPISILDLKKMIKDLSARNIGILITDHNVRETLDICEYAYIVHQGQLIAEGNSDSIIGNELVREIYLGEEFAV